MKKGHAKIVLATLLMLMASRGDAHAGAGRCDITVLSGGAVLIGGVEYRARDASAPLAKCGRSDLATIADRWAKHRTAAVATGVVGLLVFPVWIATGITAYYAAEDRMQFEQAI